MAHLPALDRLATPQARIAVIGGGKMGEAILSGWIGASKGAAACWNADNFIVVNPGLERREYLTSTYAVECIADASQLEGADLLLLAVKPQVMMDVLQVIRQAPFAAGALCVSIAAGLPTSRLESALPAGTHVVRAMPNTPLLIGAGATTLCAGAQAEDEDEKLVCDLFGSIGQAFIVQECDMDATGAINGCGPAYAAALVEALADAGELQGARPRPR